MIPQIQECYHNATSKNGLIDYTIEIRGPKNDNSGKYSEKTSRVNRLFQSAIWKEKKAASGHKKFENMITKIIVEYAAHQNMMDPGAAETILNQVQEHLNILNNVIFAYTTENFKEEPDYQAAERRWNKWQSGNIAGTPVERLIQTVHGEKPSIIIP